VRYECLVLCNSKKKVDVGCQLVRGDAFGSPGAGIIRGGSSVKQAVNWALKCVYTHITSSSIRYRKSQDKLLAVTP
jgi:hypothetical protein